MVAISRNDRYSAFFHQSRKNRTLAAASQKLQRNASKEEHPDVFLAFKNGLHVVRRSERFWAGLSSDLIIEQVLMRSVKTTGGLTRSRGFSETQRLVWLLSTPVTAEINNAMQGLTGVEYVTSEQHKEATAARIRRDMDDVTKLIEFLERRNQFTKNLELRNIAMGVTAMSHINVVKACSIGEQILKQMTGKTVKDHTFKMKEQAQIMDSKVIECGQDKVHIDPQLLFQRLVIVAKGSTEDMASIFRYELSVFPMALFESSGLMRKANKPVLADAIYKLSNGPFSQPGLSVRHVVDGGALLQRIPWKRGMTYLQIFRLYTNYVQKNYGKAIIVFDGYGNDCSTKDMTHQRRTGGIKGTVVQFDDDMKKKKELFLLNTENKQTFINSLARKLESVGCIVYHAKSDADTLIVSKAIESALTSETIVVGEDTDLLVLLLYHADLNSHKIFFKSDMKQNLRSETVIRDILSIKEALGVIVCKNILFIHAIAGCDTTSGLFGIGQGSPLKMLKENEHFRKNARKFNEDNSTSKEIMEAGEILLSHGEGTEDLNKMRYNMFCEKLVTLKSQLEPQMLPPTSDAAKYHSLRVYYQIREWKGNGEDMDPLLWGWKLVEGRLMPKSMDFDVRPCRLTIYNTMQL